MESVTNHFSFKSKARDRLGAIHAANSDQVGLDDPFVPLKALPASALFLRRLHDHFGNLGLAAAAYNAGSGRIQNWLAHRQALPAETQAYVRNITGSPAESWAMESKTLKMAQQLPAQRYTEYWAQRENRGL